MEFGEGQDGLQILQRFIADISGNANFAQEVIGNVGLVRAWRAVRNVQGISTNVDELSFIDYHMRTLGKSSDEIADELSSVGNDYPQWLNSIEIDIVNSASSSGAVFGKYIKGKRLNIISSSDLHGGNEIALSPTKTTTIAGSSDDVNVVARRGYETILTDQITLSGENIAGINILRDPRWDEIRNAHQPVRDAGNEVLYWQLVTEEFWAVANRPWVQSGISRGDKFRFVSDPYLDTNLYRRYEGTNEWMLDDNGQRLPTIFKKEIDYLLDNGYTILSDGTLTLN